MELCTVVLLRTPPPASSHQTVGIYNPLPTSFSIVLKKRFATQLGHVMENAKTWTVLL